MLRCFINTTNVGDSRWWPPLVDEDWHAACQAIYEGVEGAASAKRYYKFVDMNKAVSVRPPEWEKQGKYPCGK